MLAPIRISTIQSALIWQNKAANLAMFEQKITALGATEIVVLPEMFSTGFSMEPHIYAEKMDGNTVAWMAQMAKQKKCILTGSIIIEEDGNYYNRMLWVLPNGHIGYYDKRHLFAYAGEDQHYTAGNKRLIVQVNGWRILLQVCYDLRFPVWSRQQINETGQPEYDAIIYVANWPEKRNLAWKILLQSKAIENQCYTIGVNRVGEDGNEIYYSGDTSIFDPMGHMVYQCAHKEESYTTTLSGELLAETRSFLPFLKDADQFSIKHQ